MTSIQRIQAAASSRTILHDLNLISGITGIKVPKKGTPSEKRAKMLGKLRKLIR